MRLLPPPEKTYVPNDECVTELCEGVYAWAESEDQHILTCNICGDVQGDSHAAGEGDDTCPLCEAMPIVSIEDVAGVTITVTCGDRIIEDGNKVESGSQLNVSAAADEGFNLSALKYCQTGDTEWIVLNDENNELTVDNSITITAESEECSDETSEEDDSDNDDADDAVEKYTVTYISLVEGGSFEVMSGDLADTEIPEEGLAEGTKITVIATPDTIDEVYSVKTVTYTVEGSDEAVEIAADDGVYSFEMPDANITINVSFEKVNNTEIEEISITPVDGDSDLYQVTVDSTIVGGEIAPAIVEDVLSSFVNVAEKDIVKFTVTPSEGYTFKADSVKVTKTNDGLTTTVDLTEPTEENNYYSFEMPAQDVTITAEFLAQVKWVADEENGTYTLTSTAGTAAGEVYKDLEINVENLLRTGMTKQDIEAFSFKVSSQGSKFEGEASIMLTNSDSEGVSVEQKVEIDGDNDYELDVSDNTGLANTLYIRITDVNPNTTITISSVKAHTDSYDIRIDEEIKHGEVTASAESAEIGEEITLTVEPVEGYEFKSLSVTYKDGEEDNAETKNVTVTDNKFIMPKANVTVSAVFEEIPSLFAVNIGKKFTYVDTWADVLSFINENGGADAGVVVTLKDDYTLTSADKLPTADKAATLGFDGKGTLKIDKNVKTLKLLSKTTSFDLKVVSDNKVAVTVPADSTFILGSNYSGDAFGKITGTKASGKNTSNFTVIGTASVDQLSTLSLVSAGKLTVNGNISAVDKVYGEISIAEAKTTAVINEVMNDTVINLVQDVDSKTSKITLPKLTIVSAEQPEDGKTVTINVVDSKGEKVDLENGTIVAYTQGKAIENPSITIGNTTSNGKKLTAFYYSGNKAIKAEVSGAMTVKKSTDEKGKDYPNLDLALKAMSEKADYVLTINDDLTLPSTFALPKNINGLTINAKIEEPENEPSESELADNSTAVIPKLIITGTKLNVTKNLTLDLPVEAPVSKTNKTGKIDVAVSAGMTFELGSNYSGDIINKLSGNKTASFKTNVDVAVNQLASFGTVQSVSEKVITVNGNVSAVEKFSGKIKLNPGTKATTVAITAVEANSVINLVQTVDSKTSKTILPKLTIKSAENFTINVVDAEGNIIDLENGTIVAYTQGAAIGSPTVTIGNKSGEKALKAFYYSKGKVIKAEIADAMTVKKADAESAEQYPNLEAALDAMTDNADYILTLNKDLTLPSTFAIPKKIAGLTIKAADESGAKLIFEGTKLAATKNLTLDLPVEVPVSKTNKTGKIDVTVSAGMTFELGSNYTGDIINKLSGNKTAHFKTNVDVAVNQLATFATVLSISDKVITVNGNVSAVENLNGKIKLVPGTKATTAAITAIGEGSVINLVKSVDTKTSKTILPKLTIKSAENFTINVLDADGNIIDLENGTIVAYTQGAEIKNPTVTIGNKCNDKTLTAYYYNKTKAIKAEDSDAMTVKKSGAEKGEAYPNLELALNAMTDSADYVLTLNVDTAVANLAIPKNITGLTINATNGAKLIFTGTKLSVTKNLTLDLPVEVSNKTGKIDVAVSAAMNFELGSNYSGDVINKLSGNKTASFISNAKVSVNQLATFKTVKGNENITVNGNITAVTDLYGTISISGAKTKAAITNIAGDSTVNLIQNGTALPALTVTTCTGKLTIAVVDDTGSVVDLESGTVVAYTAKGTEFGDKLVISNKTGLNKLTPYYYKNKSIKAEYSDAITLMIGSDETGKNYPNLDEVLTAIGKLDTASAVTIQLNADITAPSSFVLPTKNVTSLKFTGNKTLTLTGKTLKIPYNVTFGWMNVNAGNTNFTVNKNTTLSLTYVYSGSFGTITGSSGSKLYLSAGTNSIKGISGFDMVEANGQTTINLDGSMTKVKKYQGNSILNVKGEKSTVEITEQLFGFYSQGATDDIPVYTTLNLYKNSKGAIPKVTLGSVANSQNSTAGYGPKIVIYENDGTESDLESGNIILYVKDKNFTGLDCLLVGNNLDSKGKETLTCELNEKTKAISVVSEDCIKLYENTSLVGSYTTFEEAIAYIDEHGNSSTYYKIGLAENVQVSKFALPKTGKASYLKIYDDGGSVINIGSASSITANCELKLDNIKFKTSAKTLTLNTKYNVTLYDETTIDSFKGTGNSTMNIAGSSSQPYDISGFGTVSTGADGSYSSSYTININTTLSVDKLVFKYGGTLNLRDTLKTGTFKAIEFGQNTKLNFESVGSSVLKFTGTANDFVSTSGSKLSVQGNVEYGTKILSTKALEDPDDYLEVGTAPKLDAKITSTFKQVGADIVLQGVYFELSNDRDDKTVKCTSWDEVISTINTANNSTANYTVKLLTNTDMKGELKLPTKGKYNGISFVGADSTNGTELKFTGSLTLTGNTTFKDVKLYSVQTNSKTGESEYASYTINAAAYDVTFKDKAYTEKATINAKNLTVEDILKLLVDKINVSETLTTDDTTLYPANGLTTKNWVFSGKCYLDFVKDSAFNVTGSISRKTEKDKVSVIFVTIYDNFVNGNQITEFTENYSFGTVNDGGELLQLQNSGYKFSAADTGAVTIVPSGTWSGYINSYNQYVISYNANGVAGDASFTVYDAKMHKYSAYSVYYAPAKYSGSATGTAYVTTSKADYELNLEFPYYDSKSYTLFESQAEPTADIRIELKDCSSGFKCFIVFGNNKESDT